MCSGVKVAVGLQVLVWPSALRGETECHDVEAPSQTACVPAVVKEQKSQHVTLLLCTFLKKKTSL